MSMLDRVESLEKQMAILIEKRGAISIDLDTKPTLNFIERVCKWNKQRYKQEYNYELTSELLQEELDELVGSDNDVDTLDALVDIVYVAIGAMWKLGLNPQQISDAIYTVCDANDTKLVARVPPHVKANIVKGEGFVPPEKRLQEILNER